MKTIKAIIVDDEKGARESLAKMIERNCPQIEIVAKADSMKSAIEVVNANNPDLVFLDIEMPKGNAFDMLKQLEEINFDIIFTTAYDHYAIKAIKFSAIDYLLKPIDPEELIEAAAKLSNRKKENKVLNEKYQTLISNMKVDNKSKKVAIADGDSLIFITLSDIIRCESDGNYTYLILTSGKKVVASHSLGEYEQMFSEFNFCRVHRSHLINLEHVKKYIKGEGGTIILSDNSEVEVSRRNKIEFLDKLSPI